MNGFLPKRITSPESQNTDIKLPVKKFQNDMFITFQVILLTNKQTNVGKNITSLAEEIKVLFVVVRD